MYSPSRTQSRACRSVAGLLIPPISVDVTPSIDPNPELNPDRDPNAKVSPEAPDDEDKDLAYLILIVIRLIMVGFNALNQCNRYRFTFTQPFNPINIDSPFFEPDPDENVDRPRFKIETFLLHIMV